MPITHHLAFLAATVVLLVIPGPTILTVIGHSVSHGRRATLPLVTALNPKSITFFVAFLPQFVYGNGDVTAQLWLMGVMFVTLAMLNVAIYASFASVASRRLSTPLAQRGFHLAGGGLLSTAGAWALLAKRHT